MIFDTCNTKLSLHAASVQQTKTACQPLMIGFMIMHVPTGLWITSQAEAKQYRAQDEGRNSAGVLLSKLRI